MNLPHSTLAQLVAVHGSRVRRRTAMELLGIRDKEVFKKVVDANPAMKHKLNGEQQTRYRTDAIWELLQAKPASPGVRSAGRKN